MVSDPRRQYILHSHYCENSNLTNNLNCFLTFTKFEKHTTKLAQVGDCLDMFYLKWKLTVFFITEFDRCKDIFLTVIFCSVFYFKHNTCRCSNYEITKHHATVRRGYVIQLNVYIITWKTMEGPGIRVNVLGSIQLAWNCQCWVLRLWSSGIKCHVVW